jgi:hypothetical protein
MCVNEICETLSSYLTVPAGGVAFAVESTGSTTNLVPQLANLNLAPNTHNTLIVVGTVDAIPAGGYLLRDDDTPATNSVKLRIASTDPTVGTLAAWVLPDGTTPSGTPTISNVMLGSATFAITCFVGPNCIGVGPTTLSANKNVTVYILSEGLSHRPLILADN